MRWLVFAFFIVFSPLVFATTASAQTAGDSLRQAEERGLRGVPKARLVRFLQEPEAAKVSFTKDWIDSQPKARGNAEWRCMTEALYFEARGETVRGQFAVAEVILNRVESTRFPDTVCGVIRQGTGKRYQCQFTYTCDGYSETIREPRAYERVGKVARAALDRQAPALTEGATHYHTTAVRPRWSKTYTRTARIGEHLFYRHTYRSAKN